MMTATGHNNSTENDGRIQIYLFDNYTPTELEKGTFLPYVANQLAFTFDKTGAGVIDVGATTTLTHTMTVTQQNSVNLSLFVHTGYLHFDREDRPFYYTYSVIDWDQDGTDIDDIQQQLNQSLDEMKDELNGKIDTETRKLQDQISNLQKALNDAIGDHDRDQAELLKKIEEYKKELADSISGLQQKLSELEAKQAEHLKELEKLKQKHDQDIAAVNARIDELAAQYAKDAADLNARLDEITESLKTLVRVSEPTAAS